MDAPSWLDSHFLAQPRASRGPRALDRSQRRAERDRRLLDGETREDPALDDSGGELVQVGEPPEHRFEDEHLVHLRLGQQGGLPDRAQGHLEIAAALESLSPARVIDEDTPHYLRCDREKAVAISRLNPSLLHETQVHLVDERGGRERVGARLPPELTASHLPQFVIDERKETPQRVWLTGATAGQQRRDWCARCLAHDMSNVVECETASTGRPFDPSNHPVADSTRLRRDQKTGDIRRCCWRDVKTKGQVEMAIPTADELSQNAAFQGLLSVGLGVLPAHAVVIRDMDTAQLHAHQAEVEALLAQLRARMKDRTEISEPELNKLAELAGLSPATIRAIAERVHTHGTKLNQAFPDLQSLDSRTKRVLIFDAVRRDEAAMTVVKRVAVESADDDAESACKGKCLTEFALELFAAQIDALNRMFGCVVLVFPPLIFLCCSIMIAVMIYEMDKANDAYTICVADCEEAGPGRG